MLTARALRQSEETVIREVLAKEVSPALGRAPIPRNTRRTDLAMKRRAGILSSLPLVRAASPWRLTACSLPSQPTRPVSPGFVDASRYTDLVDDECLRLQVWIPASLVKALAKVDPDLYQLVEGVEAIQAVILDLDCGKATGVKDTVRKQESALIESGWERLVLVREEDAEIRVLVLNNEEQIDGLVVFVSRPGRRRAGFCEHCRHGRSRGDPEDRRGFRHPRPAGTSRHPDVVWRRSGEHDAQNENLLGTTTAHPGPGERRLRTPARPEGPSPRAQRVRRRASRARDGLHRDPVGSLAGAGWG